MPVIAVPQILWDKLTEPGVEALIDLLNRRTALRTEDVPPVLRRILGEDGASALIEVINEVRMEK